MVAHHLSGRRWKSRAYAGLATILLLVAACGGGDGENTASTSSTQRPAESSTSVETTSTTGREEEAEVGAAYEAASAAFIAAAAIPDPAFPALAQTHVDPMLQQRRETLLALKADGRVIRYPTPSLYRIEITDVRVDGDVARLVACVVDDGQRVEVATGRVIASGVGTVEWSAALRRVDNTWRLAERVERARWDGVSGCAAD